MAERPRVVLLGDSIRLGYGPLVADRLARRADVTGPRRNCGASNRLLKHLEHWALGAAPSLVHFNCGLHDVRRFRAAGHCHVDVARYEANLREIVDRIRQETAAALVFATTTPVIDERHARRGLAFTRFETDVQRYNEVAVQVMHDAGVPVNDLHAVLAARGPEHLVHHDGTHLTRAGYEICAEAVTAAIEQQL